MANELPLRFSKVATVSNGARFTDTAEIAASTASKGAATVIGHFFATWGLPIATGILAIISQWDHVIEKKKLTHEFDAEIAARLGKPTRDVTVSDMEKVAKENPVINEALHRSTKKRNLSVGVVLAGGAAAAVLGIALMHVGVVVAGAAAVAGVLHLGAAATAASIPEMLVAGLAGAIGFLGVEHQLNKWGEKKFHLNEPSIDEVKKNPARQGELTVASQISYLGILQAKKQKITQEQVMTVFAAGNAELAGQIESRFGASYNQLSEAGKAEAVRQFGGEYAIPEMTEDFNNRHLRVQELAFAVSGQSSGLKSVGDIQRANVQLQKRVDQLRAQLNQLYAQKRPSRSQPITVVVEQPQENLWQQREIARRQQQAKTAAAGV